MGFWACSGGGSSVGRSVISLALRSCSRGSGPEWALQPGSAFAFFAAPVGPNGFLHRLPRDPRPLRPVRKHHDDSPPSHPSVARAFTSPGGHLQQLRQAARPAPARCASGMSPAAPPRRRHKWLAKHFQLTRFGCTGAALANRFGAALVATRQPPGFRHPFSTEIRSNPPADVCHARLKFKPRDEPR